MSSKIFLSYFLSESTPGYGGNQGFFVKSSRDMCCGDSCNQQEWRLTNHIGTHIDCPKHFDSNGKSLSDYPANFWHFDKINLIEITVNNKLLLNLEEYLDQISDDCEFLILKTGFCYKRSKQEYWEAGPGIDAASGELLRKRKPNLKVIGFDFISLTSYQFRTEGRLAHKAFLHSEGEGNPILIIEDMDLRQLENSPKYLVVAPTLVHEADGAQVTIFADI